MRIFKKFRAPRERDEAGFTLGELLVVVTVLGVLAAIAIPTAGSSVEKAKVAAVESAAANAYKLASVQAISTGVTQDFAASIESINTKDVSVDFVDGSGEPVLYPTANFCIEAIWRAAPLTEEGVSSIRAFRGACGPVAGDQGGLIEGPNDSGTPGEDAPGGDQSGETEGPGEVEEPGETPETSNPEPPTLPEVPADDPINQVPETIDRMTSYTINCPAGVTKTSLPVEGFNGTISWSNGTTSTNPRAAKDVVPGRTYTVTLEGTFDRFRNLSMTDGEKSCFRSMEVWGEDTGTTNGTAAFSGMINLVGVPRSIPSTVNTARQMFMGASKFNQDISSWDVSNINSMYAMFSGASKFNKSLNSWNVSNVTDMAQMFWNAEDFNQPLNSWKTSKVTSTATMFYGASDFNQPLSGWDVSSVTNMKQMFGRASNFNKAIGGWNTSKVTDMDSMFYLAERFNQPIGAWQTGSVTDMSQMLHGASAFNQPIGGWNTSKVTTMYGMFGKTAIFNQNLGSWNTSSVVDMRSMFVDAEAFNQNLSGWNVSKVTDKNPFATGSPIASKAAFLPKWKA